MHYRKKTHKKRRVLSKKKRRVLSKKKRRVLSKKKRRVTGSGAYKKQVTRKKSRTQKSSPRPLEKLDNKPKQNDIITSGNYESGDNYHEQGYGQVEFAPGLFDGSQPLDDW